MTTILEPIQGPPTGSEAWYSVRPTGIFASEAAEACGVSDYGQPLDVYLIKRGLKEPFAGNDYTDRGKRFEPFIAGEFTKHTGCDITTGLPMYFAPEVPFIGATPDAVHANNPRRGVEFKACNFRRAAKLGEEGTDQIFEDWLLQTQQQMFVMGWEACDVFVMVDLHTYKHFEVARNEALIDRMVSIESDLWDRIKRGDPPPPDFKHPLALDLIKDLFGDVEPGSEAVLDLDVIADWERVEALKEEIKERETELKARKARVLFAMGNAEFATLPFGAGEVVRGVVKPSIWTVEDAQHAMKSIGQVKRKGYVTITQRKSKKK